MVDNTHFEGSVTMIIVFSFLYWLIMR